MSLKKLRICYFASYREKKESKQFIRDLMQNMFSDNSQQKENKSSGKVKNSNSKRKQPKTKEEIQENSKRIMAKPYKVVNR